MREDVEEGMALVRQGVPAHREGEILALLGSQGIAGARRTPAGDLLVPASEEAAARRVLIEADSTLEDDAADDVVVREAALWSRRGLPGLVTVVLACAVVFWSLHRAGAVPTRESLLDHGAISWSLVESGEYWRLLTAVFVHFDGAHLLSNLLTLALIGPPLAHHLGTGRFLLVFVLSGIGGNALSQALVPTAALKAGASGAIAGILGALAGQTLRPEQRGKLRRWQILGALAAVYALLVGVGPDRDNTAHAGGLLAGLLLGRWMTPLDEAEAGAPGEPLPPAGGRPGDGD